MSEEIIENPAVESAEEIEEQVIVKPAKKQSNASVDNDKFDWDAFEMTASTPAKRPPTKKATPRASAASTRMRS